MRQIRFALRTLFRAPFVTTVAILSLAFGIGANAAIFSIFDQVLLRKLSVQEPDRLVNLLSPGPKPGSQSCNQAGDCDEVFSYPMFRDLERTQTALTGVAAHRAFQANLGYQGQTTSGEGMEVSGSYFSVLGLQPALGRLLGPSDDAVVGESPVVVLTHDYWHTRFGERSDVLNMPMMVNGRSLTIVGVAPAGFTGTTLGSKPNIFVPMTLRGLLESPFKAFTDRRTYWVYLFGRLRPGMSMAQAKAALNGQYHAIINDVEAPLQKGMSDKTMVRFRAKELELKPGAQGQSSMPKDSRTPLALLMAVTGVVLLIACANIANLLLARGAGRAGEMALRLSIGASRIQLVRQLLLESCLLGLMGGVAGLVIAKWTLLLIVNVFLPPDAGDVLTPHLQPAALLFAGALSLGTGVLFGLFPALHSTRPDLASTLKGIGGQPSGARSASRFRTALVVTQIALSMALLASAGLLLKSLINISHVDLGLRIDNLLTFGVAPRRNGYAPDRARALFAQMEEQLSAQPGVTAVTASLVPLLAGDSWGSDVSVQGFKASPDADANARFNEVGPGYFRALGIPLMSGREFTAADSLGAPKVAIVNQAFAKKFGLGRDAVGKLMTQATGNAAKLDTEIVGLVQDAKYSQVKDAVPPLFFRPYRQDEEVGDMSFYVRSGVDPGQSISMIRRVVASLDPNLPVEDPKTMPEQVRENLSLDRLISMLSAIFAGLATVLAAIGLYGVLAYTVSQRMREFGLRMALGADPANLRGLVLRQVGWMILIGGVIGLAGALAIGHAAEALLFQMKGYDPIVLVLSAIGLTAVGLIAGFIPARRASRTDPMKALRYE